MCNSGDHYPIQAVTPTLAYCGTVGNDPLFRAGELQRVIAKKALESGMGRPSQLYLHISEKG